MKSLLAVTAAVLIITSAPASAWWDSWPGNGNNNHRQYNHYDGRYYGQNTGTTDGDTSGDGSIGFKGDIRFKIKMKNRGNARMDGYYYDNQGNVWQGDSRNGSYYYNRYDPYYSQPYYGPQNGYPTR